MKRIYLFIATFFLALSFCNGQRAWVFSGPMRFDLDFTQEIKAGVLVLSGANLTFACLNFPRRNKPGDKTGAVLSLIPALLQTGTGALLILDDDTELLGLGVISICIGGTATNAALARLFKKQQKQSRLSFYPFPVRNGVVAGISCRLSVK